MNTKSYKFDPISNTLTLTKAFVEKTSDTSSSEYKLLKKLQRDFPNLTVNHRTHRTPTKYRSSNTGKITKRNKNKGITYERMEKFISTLINKDELMKQYEFIKVVAKNPYSAAAAWFEEQFPYFASNPLYYYQNNNVVPIDIAKFIEEKKAG